VADPNQRPARPWDLFNKDVGRVEDEVAEERLALCKSCEHYLPLLHLCAECGCIMNAKVKLPNAHCPLRRWDVARAVPQRDD